MPCNTIHLFYDQLQAKTKLKIFSLVDLAVLRALNLGHKNVGVISSDTTLKSGLYKNALLKSGLTPVLVSTSDQKVLDKVILNVMSAIQSESDLFALLKIIQKLKDKGATSLIIGCTELPLVLTKEHYEKTHLLVFDTIQIASEALVDFAYSNSSSEFNPTSNE